MAVLSTFGRFLYRFRALARKELLAIWSDPSSRAILFVPIIIDSLAFGYVATFDVSRVPYAVRDLNHSPSSISLIAHLDGTGIFRQVATVETAADIESVIVNQKALMVVQIGPRFEQQLMAGETTPIQIILDARNSTTANSAVGYVNSVVNGFNAEERIKRGGSETPLTLETRSWFNPDLLTRWGIVPGLIALLSAMQTLILTALSVAREREQGTFDQLLVTPLTSVEIMIGKAIVPMMIGLAQATIVLLITRFWFHIPMAGSLPALYSGLAVYVLAVVGIGLSVSAVAKNMQQAMLYSFGLMMPMTLLSGFMTPVASMSKALQILTLANPMRFGMDIVRRIYLEGVGLDTVALDFAPLVLIAVITLSAATWLFRNRLI